jgi:chromosome segregation ATPase
MDNNTNDFKNKMIVGLMQHVNQHIETLNKHHSDEIDEIKKTYTKELDSVKESHKKEVDTVKSCLVECQTQLETLQTELSKKNNLEKLFDEQTQRYFTLEQELKYKFHTDKTSLEDSKNIITNLVKDYLQLMDKKNTLKAKHKLVANDRDSLKILVDSLNEQLKNSFNEKNTFQNQVDELTSEKEKYEIMVKSICGLVDDNTNDDNTNYDNIIDSDGW